MEKLQKGQFFGQTNQTLHLDNITVTDTVYTHEKVDWHYHEHAYFTFLLEGKVIEGNKKEVYQCQPGTLLFHNWQEPHYNIKPPGFTRGFHIEIEKDWFNDLSFDADELQGSLNILSPEVKLLVHQIFKESKQNDGNQGLAIQSLLLQTMAALWNHSEKGLSGMNPIWVSQLRELLHETDSEKWSLLQLAEILAIHPVHLSRDFPKYFNCGFGEYLRKIKLEKALSLMIQNKQSLTEIALECGFNDQSHFIRCFREYHKINPSAYRKLLRGC